MKAENTTKIQFDALSVNESYARGAAAAFLARYDPTVPQLADIKTAVSEAVTNCIVHAYPDHIGPVAMSIAAHHGVGQGHRHPGYPAGHGTAVHHRKPGGTLRAGLCGDAELYG